MQDGCQSKSFCIAPASASAATVPANAAVTQLASPSPVPETQSLAFFCQVGSLQACHKVTLHMVADGNC